MTLTPRPKTSSVIFEILIQNLVIGNIPKTNDRFSSLRWKLCAQQPLVLNQDFQDVKD